MKNIIKKLVTFAKDKKKDKKNKTKQEVEEVSTEEEAKQEGGAANLIQQHKEAEPESQTILFHGEPTKRSC